VIELLRNTHHRASLLDTFDRLFQDVDLNHPRQIQLAALCSAVSSKATAIFANNSDDGTESGWLGFSSHERQQRQCATCRVGSAPALARVEFFFMADMQSGIGPFVGVFLRANGWASGLIGIAMTLGNVAGMLITTPFGGFIDATNYKRSWVVPGVGVVFASVIILFSQNFWAVASSQIATSVAGPAIVSAVTGITLGMVKQEGFNRQNGRNQAFNHADNMVGAAISGYLG
jgi:hypothetical protein